jgi:hypothetical protein
MCSALYAYLYNNMFNEIYKLRFFPVLDPDNKLCIFVALSETRDCIYLRHTVNTKVRMI